jgi:tRNA (guanine37-N1)-methyltransferase
MKCVVLTLFPEMIGAVASTSILRRACERGFVDVRTVNPREFTEDRHQSVDDSPYGGGPGMVLKPDPIFRAVDSLRREADDLRPILLSPQGRLFDQAMAAEFSGEDRRLVFICGRYEGIDERVRIGLAAEEVSIGDYVLNGGELAALVVIEAAARLIPGVLGDEASALEESFQGGLDYPHYTRPPVYRGMEVPEVLLSGDHGAIRRWRRREALRSTWMKRPDLLEKTPLTPEDRKQLEEIKKGEV